MFEKLNVTTDSHGVKKCIKINFYKMQQCFHIEKRKALSFLSNCACRQSRKKGKMQYLNNNNHK